MMNNEQEIGSHVLSYNFISHNLIKFFWVKQMLCFYFFLVWKKYELFPCEFKIEFSNIFIFFLETVRDCSQLIRYYLNLIFENILEYKKFMLDCSISFVLNKCYFNMFLIKQ